MPQQEITFDDSYMNLLDNPADDITDAEFDPDAEYNRPAPPIPDGWYFGTIHNAGVKVKNDDGNGYKEGLMPFRTSKWKNETREYHEVAPYAIIHKPEDPLVHEKRVYMGMPLRTKPDPERNNASSMSAAYKALAGESIKGMPGPGHAKQMVELLRGNPQGYFRVQNVLRDQDAEKDAAESGGTKPKAVYGQKKIEALPGGKDASGKFTGVADHPATGNRVAARAQIVEFKPKDWDPNAKKGA